jgi:hypothetical protein
MRYGAITLRVGTAIAPFALLLALSSTAGAAVIDVTTQTDVTTPHDGLCSLREAISEVDTRAATSDCRTADAGANTIWLAGVTYHLTIPGADEDANATGDLDVARSVTNLTNAGAGMTATAIDATRLGDRVLDVGPGATVTISGSES